MSRKSTTRLVYSTEGHGLCPQCQRELRKCVCGDAKPGHIGDGIARIRRESKGRGGKTVTVIEGLALDDTGLKALTKTLKQHCGVGGALKEGRIEIQGDRREQCQQILRQQGYESKLAGG